MPTLRLAAAAPSLALLVVLLTPAPPAMAQGVPDPRFSTTDLVVVGNVSGTPIGGSPPGFDVVVRDVNNAPLPGHVVSLHFGSTGMRVFSVQNAGTTLDCAAGTISRITNASGAVNIAARVGGYNNANVIQVFDNAVLLASVRGRSTDVDGIDGRTGLGDFAHFASNLLTNQAAQETDFDLNGTTGLGDFALFATEFLRDETLPYCP